MNKFLVCVIVASLSYVTSTAPATIFTVTSRSDSSTTGTLDWAIDQANLDSDPDEIRFNIPGPGPYIINTNYGFTLFEDVIIDGSTQPGYVGKPLITLKANPLLNSRILLINSLEPPMIRDLAFINNAHGLAIEVGGNGGTIQNCWIGTDTNFTPNVGNVGIHTGYFPGSGASDVIIDHCLIGNQDRGIVAVNTDRLRISDCVIGTDFLQEQILPCSASGIEVYDCGLSPVVGSTSTDGGNVIANCGGYGIRLSNSNAAVLLDNVIYNTGKHAIIHDAEHVILDFNDDKDGGIALGGIQNYPIVSAISRLNGTIQIDGSINSTPGTELILQIYGSPPSALSPSARQAKWHITDIILSTNPLGDANFSKTVPDTLPDEAEIYYTYTATRTNKTWGTSELLGGFLASTGHILTETDPGLDPDWVASGIDSGPEYTLDPGTVDDVDIEFGPDELRVIVRPSTARYRIAGWANPSLTTLPQSSLQLIRGKFYIYATNPMGAPLNTVPNFRIRLENEGGTLASCAYQYANTGRTSPPHEDFYGSTNNPEVETRVGPSIRPTDDPAKPSLYRLDFLPSLTVAGLGSSIGASFESYSTEDPANGALALSEIQLIGYTALIPDSYLASFGTDDNFAGVSGIRMPPQLATSFGAFNAENDFQPGRQQELFITPEVPANELATMQSTGDGILLDTAGVPENRFGVGIFTLSPNNFVNAPRVEQEAIYLAEFFVSSDMPAEESIPGEVVQGGMSFQIQTGGGAVTSRLELAGPAGLLRAAGSRGRQILDEILPGKNAQNVLLSDDSFPDGENGGIYPVFLSAPLSQDIRADSPGVLGPFGDEPGPGVNLPSFRDITMGINIISQPTTLKLTPGLTINWAQPNRARVRIDDVLLIKLEPIDDGGY